MVLISNQGFLPDHCKALCKWSVSSSFDLQTCIQFLIYQANVHLTWTCNKLALWDQSPKSLHQPASKPQPVQSQCKSSQVMQVNASWQPNQSQVECKLQKHNLKTESLKIRFYIIKCFRRTVKDAHSGKKSCIIFNSTAFIPKLKDNRCRKKEFWTKRNVLLC